MILSFSALLAYYAAKNPHVREFAARIAQRVSARGISFIKNREGFRSKPYFDIAGFKTVGYGTLLFPGHPLFNVASITVDQGLQLMEEHLSKEVDPAISRYVKVPLNQNQYDALASWIYNFSPAKLKTSTLLKKLNGLDYKGAADEFLRWNNATVNGVFGPVAGLTKRREAERELFLS